MTSDQKLRRAYARAHPVTLWFSIGVSLTGAVALLEPSLTTQTALVLPEWLRLIFNICWVVGGGASALGILRANAGLEAFGMVLVSSGLLAYSTMIVSGVGFTASTVFIASLAIGTGFRALLLRRGM